MQLNVERTQQDKKTPTTFVSLQALFFSYLVCFLLAEYLWKKATSLIGYECKLVDFYIGKKKVNIKSEYFRPFATSRHNHCRQVHPARATVWSSERLMTPSLIEKSA